MKKRKILHTKILKILNSEIEPFQTSQDLDRYLQIIQYFFEYVPITFVLNEITLKSYFRSIKIG
jgi:hypothetical protein